MNKLKLVKHSKLNEEIKDLEVYRFIADEIVEYKNKNVYYYNGGTWLDTAREPTHDLFYKVLLHYPANEFLRIYNINDLSNFMFIKKPLDLNNLEFNIRAFDFSLHFNNCRFILPLDYFINQEKLDPMDPIMLKFCKELKEEKDIREKMLNSINNIYDKLTDEQKLISEVID